MSAKRNRRQTEESEWTCKTLKSHLDERLDLLSDEIDRRFTAQEVATSTALASAEKAVLKAEVTSAANDEKQNNWRGAQSDLVARLLPRTEHDALARQVTDLSSLMTGHLGERTGGRENTNGMYLIVVTITSILAVLMSVASVLVALFLHYAH